MYEDVSEVCLQFSRFSLIAIRLCILVESVTNIWEFQSFSGYYEKAATEFLFSKSGLKAFIIILSRCKL